MIEAILRGAVERQAKVQSEASEAMNEQMILHAEHIEKPWKWRVESVQEAVKLIKGEGNDETTNSGSVGTTGVGGGDVPV